MGPAPWNYTSKEVRLVNFTQDLSLHMWPKTGASPNLSQHDTTRCEPVKGLTQAEMLQYSLIFANTMRHFQHRRGVADELSRPRSRGRGKKYV